MPTSKKPAGQRDTLTSASGRKQRSETMIAHTGSRVEPSHVIERARDTREKKAAKTAATGAKSARKAGAAGPRAASSKTQKKSGR